MSSVNFLEKLLDGVSVQWKPMEDVCRVFNGACPNFCVNGADFS